MGRICQLIDWASDGQRSTIGLESKNEVPIAWLAMFDPADIRDHDSPEPGFPRPDEALYLVADGARAVERLTGRLDALIAALGHRELLTSFTRFAQVLVGRRVALLLGDIAGFHAPGGYRPVLHRELRLLADPATPPAALLALSGLSPEGGQPHAENILIGWETGLTRHEREQVATRERRRLAWQEHVASLPGTPSPYAMTRRYQHGDLIEHPEHGVGVVSALIEAGESRVHVDFATGGKVLSHGLPAALPYAPTSPYRVGDCIEHPRFGTGRVESLLEGNKMEVSFASERRKLMRGAS